MENHNQFKARKEEIMREFQNMGPMRRGSVNAQYFKKSQVDSNIPGNGPYYVLTRKEHGKSLSRRILAGEVEKVVTETETHRQFRSLAKEFVEISEKMSDSMNGKEDTKNNF